MSSTNRCFHTCIQVSQETAQVIRYSHLFQNFPQFIVIHAVNGLLQSPGVTGKYGLGVQNEAGQRLIEFCQENTLVIANTLFQQHKTQDLLEITPKKDVLFITGDCNAKVGSQETPGVTGKFGLGIWIETEQRLIEF